MPVLYILLFISSSFYCYTNTLPLVLTNLFAATNGVIHLGVLQLVAISAVTQQPLKVNYTVSTLSGKVIKAADAVSIMEAAMKPQEVMVDIAYQDIKGRERITVKAGEPSVFTFTITPSKPKEAFEQANAAPRRLEDVLLERLQLELQKRLAQ